MCNNDDYNNVFAILCFFHNGKLHLRIADNSKVYIDIIDHDFL